MPYCVFLFYEQYRNLKPFMNNEAYYAREGIHSAMMEKTFNPSWLTFFALVPSRKLNKLEQRSYQSYTAEIVITDVKNHNLCIKRTFRPFRPLQVGDGFQYGIGIGNDSLPVGKYRVSIINDHSYKEIGNVKFKLIAYPVSEFLGLLLFIVLVPTIISFVSLILCYRQKINNYRV